MSADETKNPERIRTFQGDVNEYLQKKKISWQQLVSQKSSGERIFSRSQRRIIMVLAGFAVFLIVAGLVFFVYKKFTAEPIKPGAEIARPPQALINGGKLIEIKADAREKFFLAIQEIQNKNLNYMDFQGVYLVNKNHDVLGPKEFFDFLEISPPLTLKDALGKEITLGIIGKKQGSEFIMLMPVENFERGFAAMLRWEPTMAMDFRFFIKKEKLVDFEPKFFQDLIIKNQFTRFLNNKHGEELIGYSIFDRRILIIGFSKEALKIAIEKLLLSPPKI